MMMAKEVVGKKRGKEGWSIVFLSPAVLMSLLRMSILNHCLFIIFFLVFLTVFKSGISFAQRVSCFSLFSSSYSTFFLCRLPIDEYLKENIQFKSDHNLDIHCDNNSRSDINFVGKQRISQHLYHHPSMHVPPQDLYLTFSPLLSNFCCLLLEPVLVAAPSSPPTPAPIPPILFFIPINASYSA